MIALDSSVAVHGLVSAYDDHEAARSFIGNGASIPLHTAIETYSVMTRMPEPYRVDPQSAAALIDDAFRDRILAQPSTRNVAAWLRRLAESGVAGGAIYDALVAESARIADATLVTADRRAAATYRVVGVEVELLDA